MTEIDFYRALGDSVKYHAPNEEQFRELQTFAVIRNRMSLAEENLSRTGIDRFKPYFYSKRWEAMGYSADAVEYDFPGIFVLKLRSPITNLGAGAQGQICHDIQVMSLYPNVEALPEGITLRCKALTVEEIEKLTRDHLLYALGYAKESQYATTNVNPSGQWYGPGLLDHLLSEGEISSFQVDEGETRKFKKRFFNETRSATIEYLDDFSIHKLCGCFVNIRFCEPLCEPTPSPDFSGVTRECCAEVK